MKRYHLRRPTVAFLAVVLVFVVGTVGFHHLLHEPWHKAFYRTVVSASLTGLDSTPTGVGAEALTIVLVLSGVTIFGYLAAQIADAVTGGAVRNAWKENRRHRMIESIHDHIIICGFGRVGQRCAEEFRAAGIPYVVVDFSDAALAAAHERGDYFVSGSGTDDAHLTQAGIERARGLIVASDSDTDNLYITLSAKARRPDMTIIARATDEDAGRKLRLAGADRVVTPYSTAGRVMANMMVKPQVAAFVAVLTSATSPELSFDEIEVPADCEAAGKSVGALGVRTRTGATIVALRKPGHDFERRVSGTTVLDPGDVLIGVGGPEEISALEELFASRG